MTYDAIVVGAGGSGLAAALSIAQHGGRVLLLEARPQPGGTTGIAVGSFTAAGTSLQAENDVLDDWQAHAEDAARFAAAEIEARNNEPLRRFFLREAAATFEWLRGLGLSFVGPHPEPPNRQPRMHNVVPGAKAYVAALQLALRRSADLVTFLCDAPVTGLLREGGRVCGVTLKVAGNAEQRFHGRAVVLAGGDYANNPDLIARYKGQKFRAIEGIHPHAVGAGHLLALEAGAQLVNMDVTYGPELRFVASRVRPFQQVLPVKGLPAAVVGRLAGYAPKWLLRAIVRRLLVTWQHPENALFDDGAILLNRNGERFVDECRWPEREIAVARQPEKIAYLLLDNRLVERYSRWPHFVSTAPDIAYAYVQDYLRLRRDVSIRGSSFAEVSRRRNLNPAAVARSVEQFGKAMQEQARDPFGRSGAVPPLRDGPCVLLGPVKAYFTTTEGGAAINHSLQVLDEQGQVIPGLYAVGQNGLGGMILWGHGLHIAWALTSGRLVGPQIMPS